MQTTAAVPGVTFFPHILWFYRVVNVTKCFGSHHTSCSNCKWVCACVCEWKVKYVTEKEIKGEQSTRVHAWERDSDRKSKITCEREERMWLFETRGKKGPRYAAAFSALTQQGASFEHFELSNSSSELPCCTYTRPCDRVMAICPHCDVVWAKHYPSVFQTVPASKMPAWSCRSVLTVYPSTLRRSRRIVFGAHHVVCAVVCASIRRGVRRGVRLYPLIRTEWARLRIEPGLGERNEQGWTEEWGDVKNAQTKWERGPK